MKQSKKNNSLQTVQHSRNDISIISQKPFTHALFIIAFSLVLFLMGTATFYLFFQWSKRPPLNVLSPLFILPPVSQMLRNITLILQGYHEGYWRTIWGYFSFGMISACFLSAGRIIYHLIFGSVSQLQSNISISLSERVALYYILGSIVSSLIWLLFGLSGALNTPLALMIGIIGLITFVVSFFKSGAMEKIKATLLDWKNTFTLTEKALSILLFLILALWTTSSVSFQTYSDTLITHLVLPNFYINEGRIIAYPYHIHSYFPQNTEMLTLWALLLKSEVAAALVIWGFLCALVLFTWGFIKRHANPFIALVSLFILISAPIIAWFSTAIKNDFPVGVLIFTHFCSMAESLRHRESDSEGAKKWLILSGILCGGAIGHKLIALPVAILSAIFLLVQDYHFKKRLNQPPLILYWLTGLALIAGPWFIRAILITGNPVYPYFNHFLHISPIKPWHGEVHQESSIASKGVHGAIGYLKALLGVRFENGIIQPPNWGSSVFLMFLAPLFFWDREKSGIRMVILLAALSWLALFSYSLETRYHIAFLAFLICMSFSRMFVLLENISNRKILRTLILIIILLSSVQNIAYSNMSIMIKSSLLTLLSGFSQGNFKTGDEGMDNLRWICHLINTRTQPNEGILYVGINYAYGLKRRIYFSSDLDKQVIVELADKAPDSEALGKSMRNLGVRHLIVSRSFLRQVSSMPQTEDVRNNWHKINALLQNQMSPRITSPNGNYTWFSFREADTAAQVVPNAYDAREFPAMFIEQARFFWNSGNFQIGKQMIEAASGQHMTNQNKAYIYFLYAWMYAAQGQEDKAEQKLMEGITIAPEYPYPYIYLAEFYMNMKMPEKIPPLIKKAVERGGKEDIRRSSLSAFLRDND